MTLSTTLWTDKDGDLDVKVEFETDHDPEGPSFEIESVKTKQGVIVPEEDWDEDKWRDEYFNSIDGWSECCQRESESNERYLRA